MRLTIRNSDGTVSQPMNLDWSAALEKLAAYEDTGLTPEDILCIRATQRITPERLAEIVRAEFEERLVILPCKVGDTIYVIHDGKIWDGEVYHISYSDYYGKIIATAWVKHGISAAFEHFGKTVFLSRAEAVAAGRWRLPQHTPRPGEG